MAKFQITGGYGHVNDGRVYDEHPKFGRCKTAFVTWVCLVTGENQSKYYALSNLREVEAPRVPFMTDMEYGCAEPPKTAALAIWRPVIELPIDMLGYYKEGSRKRAIPGLVLHMTDALIVLRPPAEWAA